MTLTEIVTMVIAITALASSVGQVIVNIRRAHSQNQESVSKAAESVASASSEQVESYRKEVLELHGKVELHARNELELTRRLDDYGVRNALLESERQKLSVQIGILQAQIEEHFQRNQALESKNHDLEERLSQEIRDRQATNRMNAERMAQMNTRVIELERENRSLLTEIERLKQPKETH